MGIDLTKHFDHALDLEPASDLDEQLSKLPAKWCVYLLAGADDRPVQLLCVKNLRASVQRRLASSDEPSRRADLSSVVRRVRYSRVDSDFEQDLAYLEAARDCFPESYGGVLGFYPAWFVHVNPATTFPRFTRQNQVDKKTGRYFGPVPDKHAADKLVRQIEDAFDLCRDWEHLTNAGGGACQWRQMGKCVGPCEGPPHGISLDSYRAVIAHASNVLADVGRAVEDTTIRMRHAAAATQFEKAAKIKLFVDTLDALRTGKNAHLRPLEQFKFLAVMPGGKDAAAKLFLVLPGNVLRLPALLDAPTKASAEPILRAALSLAEDPFERPMPEAGFERVSLVTAHLFAPKKKPGEFIPLGELDDRRFLAACRAVGKAKQVDTDDAGEVRGLQAL